MQQCVQRAVLGCAARVPRSHVHLCVCLCVCLSVRVRACHVCVRVCASWPRLPMPVVCLPCLSVSECPCVCLPCLCEWC